MDIKISPSLLACDFANLEREVAAVAKAGAEYIHIDVMDGHFVPNISMGIPVVESIKKVSPMPLDVHLMITNPLKYAREFISAGADILTFHVECDDDTAEVISEIKALGACAGLSIKPKTGADKLIPFLHDIDLALIMTVEPGFGGQSFMPETLVKVKEISEAAKAAACHILIEVDGGITNETAPLAIASGANMLVAGSAIFKKSDYAAAISALRV